MEKITKLNAKQVDNLTIYRDLWLNKIFNYELYNSNTEESVRKSMKKLYESCGLGEPTVLLVDSPFACQIAANILLSVNQVGDQASNKN